MARLFVWDRLLALKRSGVTLVLTTHDMDEAAALADRIGIMDRGRLLALDTPAGLIRSLPGRTTLDLTAAGSPGTDLAEVLARLAALPGVQRVEPADGDPSAGGPRMRLYLSGEAPSLVAPAAAVLAAAGLTLTDVTLGTPTLEDVFISLTGRVLA